MTSPNIIAISSYKNAGKNETANMLQYILNTPKFMHSYQLYKRVGTMFKKGKYKITSFAYPLKRTLAALLNIDINRFEDRDFKENYYIYFPSLDITNKLPENAITVSDSKFARLVSNKDLSFIQTSWITIRQLLQVFGTECMRGIFGDRLWILSTIKGKNLIISDLRFKVELEEVKQRGGKVIYIKRDSCVPGNHASEKEIQSMYENKMFNYIVDNNGSLEDLFNNLCDLEI